MFNELRKAILVALALTTVLTACAPAQAPVDVQSQVATQVAMTVQSQGDFAAAVAGTLTAQVPVPTATVSPTPIVLSLPTTDPAIATVTPFVVVPASGGGTGSGTPLYSCSWREVKPKNNQFKGLDPIDVVWVITNTGSKPWPDAKDLHLMNSTVISTYSGQELPALKPGQSTTISFEANAPKKPGLYGMQFKVEGGLCFPALNIEVIRPPDP